MNDINVAHKSATRCSKIQVIQDKMSKFNPDVTRCPPEFLEIKVDDIGDS